jgi:hypothetical protein
MIPATNPVFTKLVMLGRIRFEVGVANGVISMPPRNFVVFSGWHYKE